MSSSRLSMSDHEFDEKCRTLGLDPQRLKIHRSRVRSALSGEGTDLFLRLADGCRLDNRGLLELPDIKSSCEKNIVSFVPAAGASSRYTEPLQELWSAIEKEELAAVNLAAERLRQVGALAWNLPKDMLHLLSQLPLTEVPRLIQIPKALYPCVQEGDSFLEVKLREERVEDFYCGRCIIVPPQFLSTIQELLAHDRLPSVVRTQSSEFSTIRFSEDGDPFVEPDGRLSIVPAGHGTLSRMIPTLLRNFPGAESVFIRNIDNVIGSNPAKSELIKRFVRFHQYVLEKVQSIRRHLDADNDVAAAESAEELYFFVFGEPLVGEGRRAKLWSLAAQLFHTHEDIAKSMSGESDELCRLKWVYRRPYNTMGQVPNSGSDVGGGPCFAKWKGSQDLTFKICVEQPHVTPNDQQQFLHQPSVCTHFNPVFVLAEMNFDPSWYELAESSTWLLARKSYRAEKVVYYESVLYELLGSSLLANVCFVSLPRIIFNPHKSLKDSLGKKLSDWFQDDGSQ